MKQSKKWSLNEADLKSIAWHAVFVMVSALVTYLLEIVGNLDFGTNSALIIVVLSTGLKFLQKYAAGK